MENKLKTRDLITIGIFTAIYLIVYIILSSVLFTPTLFIAMMPIGALLMAPVYLLFIARTQKLWAITIMGFICAFLVGFLVYGSIPIALAMLAFVLLAEGAAYMGNYKSFVWNMVSYTLISVGWISVQGGNWFAKEWIRELTINSGYSAEYADGVLAFATPLNLVILIVATATAAVISSFIAQRMLKKH
ncbi:MAG: MptD family putative ECF transporter S component, partial [Chloroflexota bacterium]